MAHMGAVALFLVGRRSTARAVLVVGTLTIALGFNPSLVHAQTSIEIDTTSVDFGMINVGNTSAPIAVTLTNTDAVDPFGPINMFGGAPPSAEFDASQDCQGATLAPGEMCSVYYTFSPSGPGTFNDTSSFTVSETADPADGEAFSVDLTGVGVNPITAAPLSHDFGNVDIGSISAPLITVITNTSSDPFGPINMFGGAPPTPEFNASQNCQGVTLAPAGTCSVSYTFSPSGPGTFNDASNFTISGTGSQADGEDFSVSLTGVGFAAEARATFAVLKDFTDDNPGGVTVTISCNTGLPLEQSMVITESAGVTFVVTNFAAGELDCSITEADLPGYGTSYNDGSLADDACSFADVAFEAELSCLITNHPLAVEVQVTKRWFDEQLGGAIPAANADYECVGEVFEPVSGVLHFQGVEDTESFFVTPHWNGGTTCTIEEQVADVSVESDDSDCSGRSVTLGQGFACTISNTRFYEGIPTLDRFGLAVLTLLLAGLGWTTLRRYS